ncbi:UNC93 [Brachionus plicatilis]|uniref:UNC93 n=1 Tax=Brachionus plicatilis TaxID=10195 RepID=A0A3M7RWB5_BRAPC|nr:UNC93 [Brachionus plicatilis]
MKSTNDAISERNWANSGYLIHKNLFVIGLAWFLLFTAFQSMANLQSSLNSDAGIGTLSLSTIYITLVISCFFWPPIMINYFGIKNTIITSQFAYLVFIAANTYPKWYTLIPSAILLGIFAGPLWTAKCTYLTEIAGFYANISGESNEAVVNRFFGIFFSMFQMSQIVGNLISSTILKPEVSQSMEKLRSRDSCGFNDCPTDQLGNQEDQIIKAQLSTVYTLCLVYILLGFLSIILIRIALNEYKSNKMLSDSKKDVDNFSLFISTVKQLKNKNQILILPLTLWLGFSLAFIGADYTKSFVACSKGVDYVGYAMIFFGLLNVIGSYLFGLLVKYVGRIPCFLTAAILNYFLIFVMMSWQLNRTENDYVFYLIPALWGLADSAWQTQVNSIYGVLFKSNQEAAFSNFRLWESVGFAVSYAYSNYLCMFSLPTSTFGDLVAATNGTQY